ncbi:hypothetical protein ABIC24_006183 [Methylobacterium radiotolerans]
MSPAAVQDLAAGIGQDPAVVLLQREHRLDPLGVDVAEAARQRVRVVPDRQARRGVAGRVVLTDAGRERDGVEPALQRGDLIQQGPRQPGAQARDGPVDARPERALGARHQGLARAAERQGFLAKVRTRPRLVEQSELDEAGRRARGRRLADAEDGGGVADGQRAVTVDGGEHRELGRLDTEPLVPQDPGGVGLEAVCETLQTAAQEQRSEIVEDVCGHVVLPAPFYITRYVSCKPVRLRGLRAPAPPRSRGGSGAPAAAPPGPAAGDRRLCPIGTGRMRNVR